MAASSGIDVICSGNEIEALLRKAAIGSGFPVGLAADLAAAGVWLCARRLDGVGAVLDAIAADYELELDWEMSTAALHLTDVAVGRSGSSLLELLVADDVAEVIVERSDAPLLLFGLAGIVAESTGNAFALSIALDDPIVISRSTTLGRSLPLDRSTSVRITVADPPDTCLISRLPPLLGIEVDQAHWVAAARLAARTYVPASEDSRHRGAGAGLSDND